MVDPYSWIALPYKLFFEKHFSVHEKLKDILNRVDKNFNIPELSYVQRRARHRCAMSCPHGDEDGIINFHKREFLLFSANPYFFLKSSFISSDYKKVMLNPNCKSTPKPSDKPRAGSESPITMPPPFTRKYREFMLNLIFSTIINISKLPSSVRSARIFLPLLMMEAEWLKLLSVNIL